MYELLHMVVQAVSSSPPVATFREVTHWLADAPTVPATPAENTQLFGLAALIASCTGFVAAFGTIVLNWQRKKNIHPDDTAAKAVKYLIEQNKALLKERRHDDDA